MLRYLFTGAVFVDDSDKKEKTRNTQIGRTLKDSFQNLIEYKTYRQEKDEELLKFLVLFFLASTASVNTEAIFSYEL